MQAYIVVSKDYIKKETEHIRDILKQRYKLYYGDKLPLTLSGKMVIIVDDGVATGNTLISSIALINEQNPSQIIVALPVGPPSVIKKINDLPSVNKLICLLTPHNFQAVGQFYAEFNQVNDNEVIRLLKEVNAD